MLISFLELSLRSFGGVLIVYNSFGTFPNLVLMAKKTSVSSFLSQIYYLCDIVKVIHLEMIICVLNMLFVSQLFCGIRYYTFNK